ncbi:MAG: MFS transporter [Candidatus Methanofastidiosia archaeon]
MKNRQLIFYSLMSAMVFATFISQAIIVPYHARELQASKSLTGIILSVFGISSVIFAPLAALISDRIERKLPIVQIGFIIGAVFSFAFYLNTEKFFLIPIRFAMGASYALTAPLLQALASEALPERRGRALGIYNALSSLGWALGSLLSGWIAEISTRHVFLFCALLSLLGLSISLFSKEKKVRLSFYLNLEHFKSLSPIYLTFFLRHTAAVSIWAFFPLFLEVFGATKAQVGFAFFLNMTVQTLFMSYAGEMADRFGRGILVRVGILGSIGIFLGFAWSPSMFWIYLLQVILGIVWSLLYVGISTMVADHSEWEVRSQAMAGLQVTRDSAGILGPLIGGFLYQRMSFQEMIYTLLPLCFLSFLVSFRMREKSLKL